jgi:hypothetical protein
MQYRTLGRTGVQVSSLVLGAMNFGAIGRTTQDEATALVEAALEGGIRPPSSTRHCDAADGALIRRPDDGCAFGRASSQSGGRTRSRPRHRRDGTPVAMTLGRRSRTETKGPTAHDAHHPA